MKFENSSRKLMFFATFLCIFSCTHIFAGNKCVWYNDKSAMTFSLFGNVSPVVRMALSMFRTDMQQVTGKNPLEVPFASAGICIVQMDKSSFMQSSLSTMGVPIKKLLGKKDAFYIGTVKMHRNHRLIVVGSDARGTAYGILELSRLAGVSPWVWWNDVTPIHKDT